MSGKVDGYAPRISVPATTTTVVPAGTAPVPVPTVAAPPPSSPAPAATFDANSPAARRFADGGTPVASSAHPQHLWGAGDGDGDDRVTGPQGENLTPEQIAALQAKRAEWQAKVGDRVGQLEHKWRYTRNTTKTNELWNYVNDSKNLDPDTRAKIESKLWKTDRDQARLDRLQAQAKTLGQGGTPEQRTALAHQLEAAKTAVSHDLSDANQVIKDAGLEVDHLAHAEGTIDPNAAAKGLPSLFSLLDGFFKFTTSFFGFSGFMQANLYESVTRDELHKEDKNQRAVQQHFQVVLDRRSKEHRADEELSNLKRYGVKG